jgi:hypothetical protein
MHHRRVKWADVTSTATPSNPGGLGSGTTGGTQAYVADNLGQWIRATSAASSGAIAGREGSMLIGLRYLPSLYFTFQTGSAFTDLRWWVGLIDGGPSLGLNGSDTLTGVDSLAFLATSGTANWLLTSTSTVSASTPVNTGVPVLASTRYEALMVTESVETNVGATIKAYIGTGGTMSGPIEIKTPSTITLSAAGMVHSLAVENKAASAKQVFFGKWAVGLE